MSQYSNETTRYQLRSPTFGQTYSPDDEQRNSQIVENQLFGGIRVHSGGTGIIRRGNLVLLDAGGTYTVTIVENKAQGKPVIEAFINQIYVFTESSISWAGLLNNTTYYLYVRLVENGTNSSLLNKEVQTQSSTSNIIPSDGIMIGAIIINEPGNSVIVDQPTGRIDIPSLGDHIVDNQNPHTPFLLQDDIVTSGLQALDYIKYRNLEIENFIISGNAIVSGNITVHGQLIISGTFGINGNVTYNLLRTQNLDVPGTLTAAYLEVASGLDIYSRSTFRNHIHLTSGITIDGYDPSVGVPLLNGSNVDNLHTHVLGSLSVGAKPISFSPEYGNTIISGETNSGSFTSIRFYNNNFYFWNALTSGAAYTITRTILPQDFESMDRIAIDNGVGYIGSGNSVGVYVYDKDNSLITTTPQNLQSQQIVSTNVLVSGGQLLPEYPITVVNRLWSISGVSTFLGDMTLWYVPTNGEKIVFDWNSSSGISLMTPQNYVDGLRSIPSNIKLEKLTIASSIANSGTSVFDIVTGSAGSTPVSIFTPSDKPELNYGALGSSFVTLEKKITSNIVIDSQQIIGLNTYLVASGSRDFNVQLITHRI